MNVVTPVLWAHACYECKEDIITASPNRTQEFCSAKCEKEYNEFYKDCGCHPEDCCELCEE